MMVLLLDHLLKSGVIVPLAKRD